jgi:hypothetical protein
MQDEAYGRVSELKSLQKAKNDEFYANRRFSRTIREVGRSWRVYCACTCIQPLLGYQAARQL